MISGRWCAIFAAFLLELRLSEYNTNRTVRDVRGRTEIYTSPRNRRVFFRVQENLAVSRRETRLYSQGISVGTPAFAFLTKVPLHFLRALQGHQISSVHHANPSGLYIDH